MRRILLSRFDKKMSLFYNRAYLNPAYHAFIFFDLLAVTSGLLAIQKRANELDLVTTTYNCRVKLFLKTENGRLTQPVDSVKAVEDLESRAIKKISPYQRNQANNWNPNQVPNQRRNKRPGEVIEIDNFDEIYHMGATPAGKKLNDNDTPPNRWLS